MGFFSALRDFSLNPSGYAMFWGDYSPKNFGDWVGPYLFEKVTGEAPYHSWTHWYLKQEVLYTVGSIARNIGYPDRAVVWGSGIISSDDTFARPKKTLLVRGPRTKKRFLELGYDCPSLFGDPALLLPFFYTPKANVRFFLGIVPHYSSYTWALSRFKGVEGVKVIDVTQPVEMVMNDIAECESIISSSLHGLIVSHALGVKASWARFGKELIGDDVKFFDYSESVGHDFFDPGFELNSSYDFNKLKKIVSREAVPDVRAVQIGIARCCPFGPITIAGY